MVELIIFGISISVWANILVALATLTLAFITWKTINHSKKQLNLLRQQNLLLQRQQEPFIEIEEFSIKNNKIDLKIKNSGSGKALQIGVSSSIYMLKEDLLEVKELDGQKMGRYDFNYDPFALLKESKDQFTGKHYVNFVSKGQKSVIILRPGESHFFDLEPLFYFKNIKKDFGEGVVQILEFKNLVELIRKNKRRFICIEFSLVYKNLIGKLQEIVPLTTFILDVELQKSLEEGYKRNIPPALKVVSPREMETLIGGIDFDSYNPEEKE